MLNPISILKQSPARPCSRLFLLILVTACQTSPPAEETELAVSEEQATREISALPTEASSLQPPAPAPEPAWQYNLQELLNAADEALAGDRLTTPIEDNAFDRYHAVLLLQPDNQRAKEGLQIIFNRYVFLSRDAIVTGELGKARALIERARAVDSSSELLAILEAEVADKQRQRVTVRPPVEIEPDQDEIELNIEGLNRRDEQMVETLQKLAVQVKEADDTLLIVARSDSEGRWIYQRMAEGVPGYRLRGDIRLGRVPKVMLLPPIE